MSAISPTLSSSTTSKPSHEFFALARVAAERMRSADKAEKVLSKPVVCEESPIVSRRWPTLGTAIGRYETSVAEGFSRQAYDCVQAGIIRLDQRRELAKAADDAGIRAFDAQLLIACAIRQWSLDRAYDSSPNPDAPALSNEYKAWNQTWLRIAIVIMMAVIVDGVILYRWLA